MKFDDICDIYGYIVHFDEDNGSCIGIKLESREASIYYIEPDEDGEICGWTVVSEEPIEYYDLVADFPEIFEEAVCAEMWLREDILDDDYSKNTLIEGNIELETKSHFVLNMI